MRYLIILFIFVGALGSIGLAEPEAPPSPVAGAKIVARVNESFITLRDVVRRATIMGANNPTALQTLIEDKVVATQAGKENIKVSDDETQKTVKERISSLTTLEEFTKNLLTPLGMTIEDYTGDMKEQLLRDKYIQSKVGIHGLSGKNQSDVIDIFVSPMEIKEFFEKNKEKFDQPAKVKTRQIILKFTDGEERIKKKSLAEKLLERLQKGEDFAALAKEYSDVKAESGGDWGWTAKGTFAEDVEKVIYSLKKGEISPVIAAEKSFIIARVDDKTEYIPAFDTPEIQAEIRRILSNQKFARGAAAIKNKLLKDASIWVDPGFLTQPPSPDK
jgi:parvulin-like peptidyl-prolyl isomerase